MNQETSIGIRTLIPVIFQNHSLMKKLSVEDKGPVWSLSLIVAVVAGGLELFALLSNITNWMF